MKRIIIIGGGITGLATAHQLLEQSERLAQPVEVLLLEASPRLGGIIQTDFRQNFLLERGPDSFISEKPEAVSLAQRLGLEAQLIATNSTNRQSFVVQKGRLQPVPDGFHLLAPAKFWPFLTSPLFTLFGKARIVAELLLPRKSENGHADESLAHFVRRRFGNEALSRIAQPLVGGIYTADPENLSLRATFPRFLDMEAQHRSIILALVKAAKTADHSTSGARYGLFLSFARGMQSLVDALVARISNFQLRNADLRTTSKASIRTSTAVQSLERVKDSGWRIEVRGGSTETADAVCLAVSAPSAAKLLAKIAPGVSAELAGIRHASTATINLAYRREDIRHPLDGFGFVVPFVEKRSLIACTFSSVKFAGRAPKDCVLLRAFVGGALQPELFALEDSKLVSRVRSDLRDLIGAQEPPLFAEISKWPNSMPQYEIGHLNRVQEIQKQMQQFPTLKIAGNAYHGPGVPDCIRSGETAADELMTTYH